MAEASAHDKQVEDLMGAEILVSGIEERKLQCIDDTADGVDDASGYEPQEGCGGEGRIPAAPWRGHRAIPWKYRSARKTIWDR